MRFAIDVAPLADLADPRTLVRLAEAAESAGWDGFSTWDSLGLAMDTVAADPFVALAGVAAATERLALLASVIVLPRRRPQLVAQAAATLDLLSGGRLVLGVGSGGDEPDFTAFHEDWDSSARVRKMDEAVRLVDAFLRGETVTSEGPDYPVDGAAVGPRPARLPRPPIWVGAVRPGGIRRAARWDGWIAVSVGDEESLGDVARCARGAGGDRSRDATRGRARPGAVRRRGVRAGGPGRVRARRLRGRRCDLVAGVRHTAAWVDRRHLRDRRCRAATVTPGSR